LVVIQKHIVPNQIAPIRLSDFVVQEFQEVASRSAAKKKIKKGVIRVNGALKSSADWVRSGEVVELFEEEQTLPKTYHLDFDIVYEDDYLAIVNKPAGIPVSGNQFKTMQNAIIGKLKSTHETDRLNWPRPVHRLDAPTSGLLIFAKTSNAIMKLGHMFENKQVSKVYHTIVMGGISESGRIDYLLENQEAITDFKRLDIVPSLRNQFLSWVEVYPHTGRTHQIRKHLAKYGYPIMGDQMYGEEGHVYKGKGLFLCAVEVKFQHPITCQFMDIKINAPRKFELLLEREKRRWNKYNNTDE